MTALHLDLRVRRGSFELNVDLEVDPGEVVAILGPSGAGKSTLLQAATGLVAIDSGRITLGAEVLDDPAAHTFVPPERRRVGVVFQDYLLFPHLSVLENVAFGLRAQGVDKTVARQRARQWIDRVGLADHADKPPSQISGGQAQRVALARALTAEPHLLLLDEPLAALDATTRADVRRDLRRHLDEFPGVRLIVTHDPIDAYVLADRVVIIEDGAVTQSGPLTEVTSRPRTPYVAELVGLNLVGGMLLGSVVTTPAGGTIHAAPPIDAPDGPVFVAVRPQSVALFRTRPDGSARNLWELSVDSLEEYHDRARVRLTGAVTVVAEVTPGAIRDLDIATGSRVWAAVKATDLDIYPR